jgi:hypothetical protein
LNKIAKTYKQNNTDKEFNEKQEEDETPVTNTNLSNWKFLQSNANVFKNVGIPNDSSTNLKSRMEHSFEIFFNQKEAERFFFNCILMKNFIRWREQLNQRAELDSNVKKQVQNFDQMMNKQYSEGAGFKGQSVLIKLFFKY